jgi:hypothetical protein
MAPAAKYRTSDHSGTSVHLGYKDNICCRSGPPNGPCPHSRSRPPGYSSNPVQATGDLTGVGANVQTSAPGRRRGARRGHPGAQRGPNRSKARAAARSNREAWTCGVLVPTRSKRAGRDQP